MKERLPFVKVCGITRLEDALHAIEAGATALGFVFWPRSPRAIAPEQAGAFVAALPDGVTAVGVFVNEPIEGVRRAVGISGVTVAQLHGDEDPSYASGLGMPVFRSVTMNDADAAIDAWPAPTLLLLDAADRVRRGGTGRTVDWPAAAAIARRRSIVLAGGLTPDNVEEAVRVVRPYGVDVSSGVERSPGVKDPVRVSDFVTRARRALERT